MNIDFDLELQYDRSPFVPIRVISGQHSFPTEALFDTGADVSIFDFDVADALGLGAQDNPDWITVVGVLGQPERVPTYNVRVSIVSAVAPVLTVEITAGFVRGLADSVGGNLLGLNFFQLADFGLLHSRRRAYLRQVAT